MAKISAKKLIKKLNREYVPYGYLDKRPKEIYNEGFNAGLDRIFKIIKGMEIKADQKKTKRRKSKESDSPKEISPMLMQYGLFLSQTSTILSSGKGKKIYSVGDVIPIMYLGKPVDFDIVEVADHGIKLISHDILAFQPYDIYGSNVYDKSSIKDYLENEFEKCFDADYIKLLNGNKFYIPSEDEIIKAYPEKEQRVKEYKNEIWWYWTGTPDASSSNYVLNVNTGGSLCSKYVCNVIGLAPAVIIGRLD